MGTFYRALQGRGVLNDCSCGNIGEFSDFRDSDQVTGKIDALNGESYKTGSRFYA
jgi:hypothetical protein